MLLAAASFWLGVYATVVSTAVALLTLYGELFQRVSVRAEEQVVVERDGRRQWMRVDLADALKIPEAERRPILVFVVRNRGRRTVQIRQLGKRYWFTTTQTLFTTEKHGELPADIEAGHLHAFVVEGLSTPYELGSMGSLSRAYAVDGAERIHPLRERWLQAVEDLVFYRPRAWLQKAQAAWNQRRDRRRHGGEQGPRDES